MNALVKPYPAFALERCADVIDEIGALMMAHYEEVSHHPDIPPGCDYERYQKAEALGLLRIYTVRFEGRLVGYEVFTIGFSWHYKTSFQARMDTVFIHPQFRLGMVGYRFLRWVVTQLEAEGVQISYQHDKILPDGRLNLGPLFERMGYKPIYRVYWKRHDGHQ